MLHDLSHQGAYLVNILGDGAICICSLQSAKLKGYKECMAVDREPACIIEACPALSVCFQMNSSRCIECCTGQAD